MIIFMTSCRAFDVEMLYIAQQLGMPIKEVPVNWQEIDGMSVFVRAKLAWLLYFTLQ